MNKESKNHPALVIASLIMAVTVAALLFLPGWKRGRGGYVSYLAAPATAEAAEFNPWTLAVQKVKEDRGQPTGKQAKVEIPHQLRHYSDTRRFLAIQVAEWRQHRFQTPQDFVDLAGMIKSGEMVALKPVAGNYILFGVGGSADKQAFTRYENGKSISLYNESALQQEYARMTAAQARLENDVAGLRRELGSLSKRERAGRIKLQTEISELEQAVKAAREEKESLDRSYGNAAKRGQLFQDYETLASLGRSFPGRTYDIADISARREMKTRMLSSLRPEALKVLEEIATSYQQKFERPLPITSLVRPDEYQHLLSKTNPNATRIETPPHSTGLAFDILYRYMTAEEQTHVMAHLARLKDEGRIEVLRENRDHYHVFAFIDGARPAEGLIAASLGGASAARVASVPARNVKASSKAKPKSAVKPKAIKRARAKRR